MTQLAAEAMGVPAEQVRFEWGDTDLPFGAMAGASSQTLSVGSAVDAAANAVRQKLVRLAIRDARSPLYGVRMRDVVVADGRLFVAAEPARGETHAAVLARHGQASIEAKAVRGRTFGRSRYGRSAFGAQFARVTVDPDTGLVRVARLVGAFGCGRILNPVLAESQLVGGMIWGLGQGLFEQSRFDARLGRWMGASLAEALVPVQADVPAKGPATGIEAILVEEDDRRGSRLGVKGLGEIGVTGVAAAIANAVAHATGRRIRDLPLTPDRVLGIA
jgi:xanthine dehydrogenase YagR molybdenum-binding subunit